MRLLIPWILSLVWWAFVMAALFSAVLTVGCALPTRESIRPRGLDVWVEGGRSVFSDLGFSRTQGTDWRTGINIHFDLTYADEYEADPEE